MGIVKLTFLERAMRQSTSGMSQSARRLDLGRACRRAFSASRRALLAGSQSMTNDPMATNPAVTPPATRRALRNPRRSIRTWMMGAHTNPPNPVPLRIRPMATPRLAVYHVGETVTAGR
jgi:hypothetical protein